MSALPAPVHEYIYELAVESRSPAYFLVAKDGRLSAWGGNLEPYGISTPEKGTPVGDQVPFLEGVFPFDEGRLFLPCVKMDTGVCVDVHVFSAEGVCWVLLLDATLEEAHLTTFQQKAHELCLLRDKHAKILDQYLGKEISEKLVNLTIQETGERKDVSILFADIRGFSAYSEERAPSEVFETLNAYLATMIQPILDEGGIIDKIMGDAVMAIFGLLPASRSPSMQSVKAAFRIIENLAVLNNLRKTLNCFTLDVGMGVASGPIILGILGSKKRRTLSAIGHHVNLASRLESQAPPGEIFIDKNTYARAAEFQNKFSETTVVLKGIDKPLQAFLWKKAQ